MKGTFEKSVVVSFMLYSTYVGWNESENQIWEPRDNVVTLDRAESQPHTTEARSLRRDVERCQDYWCKIV